MSRLSLLRRPLLLCILSLGQLSMPMLAEETGEMMEVRCIAEFSIDDLQFDTRMGFDVVELDEGKSLNEIGKPSVPFSRLMIALPEGMEATGVRIIGVEEEVIPGDYILFPAQPPYRVGQQADESLFVQPDMHIYGSNEPFPLRLVELSGQADLAGQGMAAIQVFPLRYVPAEKKLMLVTSVEFVIEGRDGYVCGDYLPIRISDRSRSMYEKMVGEMVANPEDVALRSTDNIPLSLGVGPGEYEYVIISPPLWMDDFQPLADWKTKKGVSATVVDREWIYSEYNSGLWSYEKRIRAFVQDAHDTWGTTYFLLGGDSNTIPFYTYTNPVGSLPSDTYYGDFDDDWICEVHIGRASVRSRSAIDTFIEKVFAYERHPPLTDFARRAGFFGFDLYEYGSNEGEGCKEDIDILYVPSSWDISKVYDSHSGNHDLMAIDTINDGQNLLNHIDHANAYFLGTGSTVHGWGLDNSDMDALYNAEKQSIFYSIGCDPCAFDNNSCIAEHFVRNENGGGIAFIGNSRSGYYSPWNYDFYSLRYDRYFFRSLFSQNHYRLGDCFSDHKNDAYQNNETYRFIFQELTLLGDPEIPIWTKDPQIFDVVSCPDSIGIGSQYFTVRVEEKGWPVEGAMVCLMKGSEVYAVGTTDPYGSVTLMINTFSPGTMDVTVTARNYLPYEGSCVVAGEVPDMTLSITPDATIIPRGGLLGYTISVTNNSNSFVSLDYWTDIVLWNGKPYQGNPIFNPFPLTIEPYGTRWGHLAQSVPYYAPSRTYRCYGRIGGHPSAVWEEDYFEFTIVEPGVTSSPRLTKSNYPDIILEP